ncbi:PocR ligand-binding domain-containing protein [Natranaerofaba carboxydovora]|uniref:PocR ligand-binding domain-containing protein n=1 Tax=Natranaerofaba carboxydovora TaxID=2742683 RepID=UPI001F131210|nr:PocR ligand-binding domain-containing protein [Natranaerofaba carboxydovora]UMZ74670.1 Cyclic di-GMP phosphodiesterase response regulator RpfG [Natranaerofaba carboxydovora]
MVFLKNLQLEDIIDSKQLQSMMDDFYSFTGLPGSIIDMNGKVLVGVGWQEICTKFHRIHPETRKHCIESDIYLSRGVPKGTYKTYKCKNNLWDIVTPIVVNDIQMGNIFMGQFMFEDDNIDYEFFRSQARKYGFDEEEYIASLKKIPRFKKENVDRVMNYYIKLAHMISELGYSNLRYSRILQEREQLVKSLQEKEERLRESEKDLYITLHSIGDGVITTDTSCRVTRMNPQAEKLTEYSAQEAYGKKVSEIFQLVDSTTNTPISNPIFNVLKTGHKRGLSNDTTLITCNGTKLQIADSAAPITDQGENVRGAVMVFSDVTEQYLAKEELIRNEARLQSLVNLFQYDAGSVEELRSYAFHEAIKLTGSKLGHFYQYDEDKKEFSLFSYSEGVKDECTVEKYGEVRKLDNAGIWAEAVRQRKPIIINDYEKYTPLKKGQPKGHAKIHRYLGVPIFKSNKIVAVMGVANKKTDYTQTDALQLSLFIDNIWKALERKWAEERIRYLSFHDKLTGLYNRSYMEEKMQELNYNNNDEIQSISIVMADLNGLKLVNDTFGHLVGDEMLKKIANILIESCHEGNIIARWGGDEFVILLPQTQEEEARDICKKINDNCKEVYIKDIPISVTLGAATRNNTTKSLLEVLKEAENDMYKQKLAESRSTRSAILNTLLKTLEEKSYETEAHALRMQKAALKIGEKLGLSDSELRRLKLAIILHDIGKINISESILTKEGPLTEEEWETMKEHPEIGYRIACATQEFSHVAEDILSHHERFDGKGYPRGLKAKEIPLLARITAIVDAYEVMTNGRPYKKPMLHQEIIAEFKRCAGTQFDPELVEVFLNILD